MRRGHRLADIANMQRVKERVATDQFQHALADDQRQADHAQPALPRRAQQLQRGHRHQAVGHARQPAQAVVQRAGDQRGQAQPTRGRRQRAGQATPRGELVPQQQKRTGVQQQVVERHVGQRIGDQPPPLACRHGIGAEDKRQRHLPDQQRHIHRGQQGQPYPHAGGRSLHGLSRLVETGHAPSLHRNRPIIVRRNPVSAARPSTP